jgi:SAM-dependent methyltransferase
MNNLDKVKSHFDKWAGKLRLNSYEHKYTMNSVRLKIVMGILEEFKIGRLLDLGCGEAHTTREFLKAGWHASGIELSEPLADSANQYLAAEGFGDNLVIQGSATDLSPFPNESFDVVTCLGVAYYIEDQKSLYSEVARVLKKGGIFICSHHNILFNLYTFNKYTIQFFKDEVISDLPISDQEKANYLDGVAHLLAFPEEPKVHNIGSARDDLIMYPENPLTYDKRLKEHNMSLFSPILFHGWHALPPLLMNRDLKILSQENDYGKKDDWRGTFMAAHFIGVGIKD